MDRYFGLKRQVGFAIRDRLQVTTYFIEYCKDILISRNICRSLSKTKGEIHEHQVEL